MADAARTQLRVGRLVKAHGLKGAIKLELYTDDPERRFVPGAEFSLQVPESSPWHGKHLVLRELRWYNGHPVGFFDGVDDRTAAEGLVKAILWVEHVDQESPEPDAWYDHQLVGLAVVRDGVKIGEVTHVDHLPAQDLLIVKTKGREVMVPVRGRDRARGRHRGGHADRDPAARALRGAPRRRARGRDGRATEPEAGDDAARRGSEPAGDAPAASDRGDDPAE